MTIYDFTADARDYEFFVCLVDKHGDYHYHSGYHDRATAEAKAKFFHGIVVER